MRQETEGVTLTGIIVYCMFTTLTVLPFVFFPDTKIKAIRPVANPKVLTNVAWFSFAYFLIFLFLSASSIVGVLTGDIKDLRSAVYAGEAEDTWMTGLPPVIQVPVRIINSVYGSPWILQFLAFFAIIIQKLPSKYFYMLIAASLMGPIRGIIGVDRSSTAYWLISFFACYVFFRRWMGGSQKGKIRRFAFFIVSILAVYLGINTIARFEGNEYSRQVGGTEGGLITYLGQPVVYFANYWEHYESPYQTLQLIFPFIHKFILVTPNSSSTVALQNYLSWLTGHNIGVFYSFFGHVFLTAGKLAAIIFCCIYSIVSFLTASTLKRIVRLDTAFVYLFLSSVMFLGVFTHYYAAASRTMSVIVFYIIIKYMISKSTNKSLTI